MIDAAGTMYLIGGNGDNTGYLNDVWSSADKGANRTRGGTQGVLTRYSGDTQGALSGYLERAPRTAAALYRRCTYVRELLHCHGTLGTAGTDGMYRSATTDECAHVPAWVGIAGVGRHRRRGSASPAWVGIAGIAGVGRHRRRGSASPAWVGIAGVAGVPQAWHGAWSRPTRRGLPDVCTPP